MRDLDSILSDNISVSEFIPNSNFGDIQSIKPETINSVNPNSVTEEDTMNPNLPVNTEDEEKILSDTEEAEAEVQPQITNVQNSRKHLMEDEDYFVIFDETLQSMQLIP
ncbi:hypothetical protein HK096_000547 [Nowakowskiella sp. JEL0078]|nr:hypothetical protein HK096_000547 [Nowakowskiella sp. JEL0078]